MDQLYDFLIEGWIALLVIPFSLLITKYPKQAFGFGVLMFFLCYHCIMSIVVPDNHIDEQAFTPTPPIATVIPTPESTMIPYVTKHTVYISPEPTTSSTPIEEKQPVSRSFQLEGYNQQTNSYCYIEFGNYAETPILWRVLEVNETDALLFSEEIIEIMRFDDDSVDWENSNVRNWLNSTFFNNAFNNEEISGIRNKYVMEPVFLLSVQDLTKAKYGFNIDDESIDPNRAASVSGYVSRKYGNVLHIRNRKSIYYTSDASSSTSISSVVSTGRIGTASIISREYDDVGIRPAIWIGIDNLNFTGGNGTYDDPYR